MDLEDLFTITDYSTVDIAIPFFTEGNDQPSVADKEEEDDDDNDQLLLEFRLECSKAATTDYDLTGQILWPVSMLLSHYIASLRGKRLVENRTVVELGAGCGLPGLVAARFAQQVLLTDGNEIVMDLLDRNTRNVVNARSMRLEWGTAVSLPNDLDLDAVDVVIAADVVQWPAEVEPLLQTVKALLGTSRCDRPTFALGIVNRAQNTYNQFFGLAQEMGFAWEKVPEQTFLPDGQVPACCQEFGGRVTEIFEVYLVDRPPALQNLPPPPPPQDLVVGQQQQQKQQQQQDSS